MVKLSPEVGVSHQRHKLKTIAHYLIAMGVVVAHFIIGFRRIRGIKAPAANLFLKVGVSHQIYRQQMLSLCRMVMDRAAVRFMVG